MIMRNCIGNYCKNVIYDEHNENEVKLIFSQGVNFHHNFDSVQVSHKEIIKVMLLIQVILVKVLPICFNLSQSSVRKKPYDS